MATEQVIRYACMGRRMYEGDVYIKYVSIADPNETFTLSTKDMKHHALVGCQYDLTIEVRDDGSRACFTSGPKAPKFASGITQDCPYYNLFDQWAVEDRLAAVENERQGIVKRKEDLDHVLEPLRKIYAKLNFGKHTAFEVWLLGEIRKSPRRK